MIGTGIEKRIQVQQVIESQLPEFILSESPKTVDFLRQYYISQEHRSGVVDLSDNLDQYLKLDNLTPEVIVGVTTLTTSVTTTSDTINVSSTKGFPNQYGLLKIDDVSEDLVVLHHIQTLIIRVNWYLNPQPLLIIHLVYL